MTLSTHAKVAIIIQHVCLLCLYICQASMIKKSVPTLSSSCAMHAGICRLCHLLKPPKWLHVIMENKNHKSRPGSSTISGYIVLQASVALWIHMWSKNEGALVRSSVSLEQSQAYAHAFIGSLLSKHRRKDDVQ